MHKVLSWKITGLFQNYRYFSIFTDAVLTGTIVIIPVGTVFITSNPKHTTQGQFVERIVL